MKTKLALFILPLISLVGCNQVDTPVLFNEESVFVPFVSREDGLPVIHMMDTDHTTYLMMSMYGYLDFEGAPVKGDVNEKFYQNTIVWKAEAGSDLPVAKSEVSGATFRGWAFYDESNENVYPDYYLTVPTTSERALKAIFDGTSGGGGGGQHQDDDDETMQTWTVTALPEWLPNDDAAVFAWAWGGNAGNGTWYKVTMTKNGSSVSGTFSAPSGITGFNMARCVAGTAMPNWNVHDHGDGRVYNKCGDVVIMKGVYSYASPSWVEYN